MERPTRDRLLFTPGPLTTSATVKQAMLRDLGSRDAEFIATVQRVREKLLEVAGVRDSDYECVLVQGSGTFCVESVITSIVPPRGKLLVAINGAYGERICRIAETAGIEVTPLRFAENEPVNVEKLRDALSNDEAITTVAIVHSETTTGIINPIDALGPVVAAAAKSLIVDAMSSFGAIPLDIETAGVDFLVSSANKCIEGVPGFAFAICRRDALVATEGNARGLSLDLLAQWRGLEKDGQFRFTPPTHAILAFDQALRELEGEGGVEGRGNRYRENHETLVEGMSAMGFRPYLPQEDRGYIITSFHYPADPKFVFEDFYQRLADKGFIIYPGKLTKTDCFRIGTIGRIFPADVRALLTAIREVLDDMGIASGA